MKIIKATDQLTIPPLTVLIYGQEGVGKTTLGLNANTPLLLDFDKGLHRSGARGNAITIDNWEDIIQIMNYSTLDDETKEMIRTSKTIVIDTLGKLQDVLIQYIVSQDYKMGNKNGGLSLQGYGVLASSFRQFITSLKSMGKDVVLIAHENEDKQGDTTVFRPDVTGKSYSFVRREVDLVGRFYMNNNQRVINFNPTDNSVGKNCANFEIITDPNIGNIILQTKQHMENVNKNQLILLEEIKGYQAKIDRCTKADKINSLIEIIKSIESTIIKQQVMSLFQKKTKELELVYLKDKKIFIDKEPDVEQVSETANQEQIKEIQV